MFTWCSFIWLSGWNITDHLIVSHKTKFWSLRRALHVPTEASVMSTTVYSELNKGSLKGAGRLGGPFVTRVSCVMLSPDVVPPAWLLLLGSLEEEGMGLITPPFGKDREIYLISRRDWKGGLSRGLKQKIITRGSRTMVFWAKISVVLKMNLFFFLFSVFSSLLLCFATTRSLDCAYCGVRAKKYKVEVAAQHYLIFSQ